MKAGYYIIIFLASFMLADLGAIYLLDFIFLYLFFCFTVLFVFWRLKNINLLFVFLLLYLVFSVFHGIGIYGLRAIGEGRSFYWLFLFSVPVYFYLTGRLKTLNELDKFFKSTYLVVVISVLILFIIEVLNGGRLFFTEQNQEFAKMEDVRGVRYLGTEETFHLCVAVVFMIIDQFVSRKKNRFVILLIILLTAIIIFTKNRTAFLSLVLSLMIVFITEGNMKLFLKIGFTFILAGWLSFLIFPDLTKSALLPFVSAFDVTNDETGNWRLMIQAVAIKQGLQTPLLGQGFGGYFEYFVEEINQTIEYPPHSIYVYLFQKTGIIGLLLYIGTVFSLIRESSVIKRLTIGNDTAEKYRILFKVLFVVQIPYGFAYNFTLFFGLYIGMFVVLKYLVKRTSDERELKSEYA